MTRKIITSALPYPNGPLHLGHIAGVYLPADIYYRFCRNRGEEVMHISGCDEHGVAIQIAAEKYQITIAELLSRYHQEYSEGFKNLGIDFTYFGGTDTPEHTEIAHSFFHKIYDQGLMEERIVDQIYCNHCNKFLPDRYVSGICPHCQASGALGDQCEACGSMLSPAELISPTCKTCGGQDLEIKQSKHLFFLLDKFQSALESRLNTKKDTRKANIISTALNKWIKENLQARCYSRDISDGISIPLEGYESKTIYVWFEAVLGYISITLKYLRSIGKEDLFEEFWKVK